MANLTESETYDTGVYQIETVDPVQGGDQGVTNKPLKNLANRTAWLKKTIDGILQSISGFAAKDSPTLTGSPKTPTPALGDNSKAIVNSEFVQGTVNGVLYKSVAGAVNVTLTAIEAGNAILILTGAITANISVILPRGGQWIVLNQTTGGFTITMKNAAGFGVAVTQSRNVQIVSDGTNVSLSTSDFRSPSLTEAPTTTTPAKFDVSTRIANMAALKAAGLQFSGVRDITASGSTTNLAATDAGSLVSVGGAGGATVVLPAANSVPTGATFTISSYSVITSTHVLRCQASDIMRGHFGNSGTASTLRGGDTLVLVSDGGNSWVLASDATAAMVTRQFAAGQVLAGTGYQKLPGGLVLQWMIARASRQGLPGFVSNFPIAFPSTCVNAVATHLGSDPSVNVIVSSVDSVKVGLASNYGAASDVDCFVIAIGY